MLIGTAPTGLIEEAVSLDSNIRMLQLKLEQGRIALETPINLSTADKAEVLRFLEEVLNYFKVNLNYSKGDAQ